MFFILRFRIFHQYIFKFSSIPRAVHEKLYFLVWDSLCEASQEVIKPILLSYLAFYVQGKWCGLVIHSISCCKFNKYKGVPSHLYFLCLLFSLHSGEKLRFMVSTLYNLPVDFSPLAQLSSMLSMHLFLYTWMVCTLVVTSFKVSHGVFEMCLTQVFILCSEILFTVIRHKYMLNNMI